MDPLKVNIPEPNSHWDRAAVAVDIEISYVLEGFQEKYPELRPDELRSKFRSAIASYYGADPNSSWEQIRDTALEKWEWAINLGLENDWDFERIQEAFRRGDHNDRCLLAGLEFAATPEALLNLHQARIKELDEAMRINQNILDETGSELRTLKKEIIREFGLGPQTTLLDAFDKVDSEYGTTLCSDLLARIAPKLKEASRVPPNASEAEIRSAANDIFSEI